MPKRTICIQNPSKISVRNASLVISQDGLKALVPLEDIWVVILETQQAQITTKALSELVGVGIVVMTCSDNHFPSGLLIPLAANSRQSAMIHNQLCMSRPLQKRLWQRIVKAKIANQASVLDCLGIDSAPVRKWLTEVKSGDASNRESVAASAYFKCLLSSGTRREGPFTAALDYGYAILRAGVARSTVSGGWLVSKGICHSNKLNAFNLVDDLIEPFRPVIDLLIIGKNLRGPLTHHTKLLLARVFEQVVKVDGKNLSVQSAIETELDTFRESVLSGDVKKLMLPEIVGLDYVSLDE